jgi:Na+/pantothenate symporter
MLSAIAHAVSQELAKLAGSMLGSQFIPVYHPRRPKAMLLAMSAAMLLFFAAFGLAMHFKGGAAAMLLLVALEYTAGGYAAPRWCNA